MSKLAAITLSSVLTLFLSAFSTTQAAMERTPNANEPIVSYCSAAVNKAIHKRYGPQAQLVLSTDKIQAYFVSNGGIEGLHGDGMIRGTSDSEMPQLKFDCVANLNTGEIQKATYTLKTKNVRTVRPAFRVANVNEPAIQACGAKLMRDIKNRYGSKATLEVNYVNAAAAGGNQERFSAAGIVSNTNISMPTPVSLSCTFDHGTKKVVNVAYQ